MEYYEVIVQFMKNSSANIKHSPPILIFMLLGVIFSNFLEIKNQNVFKILIHEEGLFSFYVFFENSKRDLHKRIFSILFLVQIN